MIRHVVITLMLSVTVVLPALAAPSQEDQAMMCIAAFDIARDTAFMTGKTSDPLFRRVTDAQDTILHAWFPQQGRNQLDRNLQQAKDTLYSLGGSFINSAVDTCLNFWE